MDADKLTEAIRLFRESLLSRDIITDPHKTWGENLRPYEDAFREVAQWLFQQPLVDRMTDEEKEKIREIYFSNRPMTNWVNVDKKLSAYVCQLLESIFGTKLFNEVRLRSHKQRLDI